MTTSKATWKDQFSVIDGNSNFHQEVREIFSTDSFFSMYHCYQEVFVCDLIPEYPYRMHRFDWYIDELATVVELHGQQHFMPVRFGDSSYAQVQQLFRDNQTRDKAKRQAAIEAGYRYVSISYTQRKELSGKMLKALILGEAHE